MRRTSFGLLLCLLFLVPLVLNTGCARKSKTVSPTFGETEGMAAEDEAMGRERTDPMVGEGPAGEFEEGELPIPQTELAREMIFEEASREMQTIYFDYDKSVLKPEAKRKLERGANWLKRNPNVNLQIQGHCDERGTNEYNLALGERRALAARRYLVSLGINPGRIFTISYGEEKPAVVGHDESAWKFNRRAEFGVKF